MPGILHGIHKRPGAKEKLARLLKKTPAKSLRLKRPASAAWLHWPVAGLEGIYSLIKLDRHVDWNEFTSIEYEIRHVQQQATPRSDRPVWGKALPLHREQNGGNSSRFDLAVRPKMPNNRWQEHAYYHRLVGLTLLYCHWDDNGDLLAHPYLVRGAMVDWHEVHHTCHWSECSVKHLAVVTIALHQKLTSGQVKSLPRPPGGLLLAPPSEPY